MLEAEAKARCAHAEARARLEERGATLLLREEQRDTYLAHPQRDFAATDEALRLREAGGRVELTYKGRRLDACTKTREELTVRVDDAAQAALLLERLGFRAVARVAKRREAWRLGEAEVALDEVQGLGSFVEVELRGEARDAAALAERCLALLRELGGQESIRASYLELLLAQG